MDKFGVGKDCVHKANTEDVTWGLVDNGLAALLRHLVEMGANIGTNLIGRVGGSSNVVAQLFLPVVEYVPVLESILPSNRIQVERVIQMVTAKGRRRVGVLGFSFKAGTDDLRESPLVELVERLNGKGYDLRLYDSNVNLAKILGANREYILKTIPHISTLMMDTIEDVLDHGEVIIVGNDDARFCDIVSRLKPHQVLVDMIGVPGREALTERYDGVNW